jgi:hypothetical protein
MNRVSLLTAGLVLAAATHPALAGVYKWTDGAGNVHYTQSPPPDRQAERMKPPPPPPANSGYTPPKLGDAKQKQKPAADDPVELAKKREEMIKKNCEAAKNNLQVYTAHRRVQEGEGGKVIVLDDKERQKRIEASKKKIEKYCKE